MTNLIIERKNQIIISNVVNQVPTHHITELAGSLGENTKRAYLSDIKQFFGISDFAELTIDMVAKIRVSHVNRYFQKLDEEGKSPSTINRKLQALSKFYKFMARKEIGIVEYNPFSSEEGAMRFKSKNYSNTRSLQDEEVRAIMEVITKDNSILGIRNQLLILLLATTGMRREELVSLKIGDIKKSDGKDLFEFVGKGKKERLVVIAKSIMLLIEKYLSMREVTLGDKSLPLFISHSTRNNNIVSNTAITTQSIYNLVKKVANEAGIDASSVSPHCFRHTYVTRSLEMGVPLTDIQDRVGHADISTTKRYAHTKRILEGNPADALADIYTLEH